MLEALIDAIQDLLSNSDGHHVDVDSSDFLDQLDLQGIDLSQYTSDEIREALDYALAHDSGYGSGIDSDHQGHEITFEGAKNDGTYIKTGNTVEIRSETGVNKGTFDVYTHYGSKYVDFKNEFVKIKYNGYLDLPGSAVKYITKKS